MEIENVSFDILEWFPILYCQEVFKYLKAKDVLEASAVNKEWYKFTGENQQMRKVKIDINYMNQQEFTGEAMDMMRNSKRTYQHIKLQLATDEQMTFFADFIANRAGSLKSIHFTLKEMGDQEMWHQILQAIEPTIEKFSIFLISPPASNSLKVNLDWTFPNLKYLHCSSSRLLKFFLRCTSLITFKWETPKYKFERDATENILTLLRNNHKVREMQALTDGKLIEHAPEFKFRLKSLIFSISRGVETTAHLFSFLELHAPTLETLTVREIPNNECLELILTGMPRLTSLKTSVTQAISKRQHVFPVNTTITDLEIRSCSIIFEYSTFDTFIRALPGLKHLNWPYIGNEHLLLLARHLPALESLATGAFYAPELPDGNILPNIKKFSANGFSKHLQEPTGETKFVELVAEAFRDFRVRFEEEQDEIE